MKVAWIFVLLCVLATVYSSPVGSNDRELRKREALPQDDDLEVFDDDSSGDDEDEEYDEEDEEMEYADDEVVTTEETPTNDDVEISTEAMPEEETTEAEEETTTEEDEDTTTEADTSSIASSGTGSQSSAVEKMNAASNLIEKSSNGISTLVDAYGNFKDIRAKYTTTTKAPKKKRVKKARKCKGEMRDGKCYRKQAVTAQNCKGEIKRKGNTNVCVVKKVKAPKCVGRKVKVMTKDNKKKTKCLAYGTCTMINNERVCAPEKAAKKKNCKGKIVQVGTEKKCVKSKPDEGVKSNPAEGVSSQKRRRTSTTTTTTQKPKGSRAPKGRRTSSTTTTTTTARPNKTKKRSKKPNTG